jgi:hypothetical protein
MSNVGQTIATIGTLVALISAVSFWMHRALTGIEGRIDRIEVRMDRIEVRMDRIEDALGEIKTLLMQNYGERIARLEEQIPHGS